MSKIRQERTADHIQIILSELFLHAVSDPRLAGVTITQVLLDRELLHANVYVNALGDETREAEVMAGLESAGGFLRREVAQRLDLRAAPILRFHWDPSLRYADEVNALLDRLDIQPETPAPAAPASSDEEE